MQKTLVVRGRLTGPRSVELNEPVTGMTSEVEVLLRPAPSVNQIERLSQFLRRLPPGTRTKDDIDQQVQNERASWGDR